MNYRDITRIASGIEAKDLAILALSKAKYEMARASRSWAPISMSIEVTYWCNRRCAGCYIPNERKTEKPVIEQSLLEKAVNQAKDEQIPFVGFAGGEPLAPISRDKLYSLIRKNPLSLFFVFTNGDYLPSLKDEIKQNHNLAYMVSLDGLEEVHDRIRGAGSFRRVTKSFETLSENKKIFGASITVRRDSASQIGSEEFFRYLSSQKVRFARIRTVKGVSEGISRQEEQSLMDLTDSLAKRYGVLINWGGLEDPDSDLPSKDLLVGMEGTLRASRFNMEESFGNLAQESLRDIIKRIRS
ncbi:Radical SAM superfamily protein [uncultured archaeon]|nr:Radical SAM superfamily protein [uncultured archaeon]